MFKKVAWSPYICGAIIGLLQIPAFLIVGKGIGTSSAYVKIVSHLLSIFSLTPEDSYFYYYLTNPGVFWQFFLVIGVVIGAYISSKASKTRRSLPSPIWQSDFRLNDHARNIVAFIGGFFLIFGARLAGGCTSGHGITGIGQLAVGSILTIISMFAFGIFFTFFWRFIANKR